MSLRHTAMMELAYQLTTFGSKHTEQGSPPRQSNGGFSHVDASVSSSSCQASKSICSFFLRASPSGQRSLHRPTNMARNQRVAVLYWLQNVGKDTTQTDLAESTTLYGSPLPLTTRLLADHCSTFEGGLYSTQAHLDAAGYSSLSDFFNSTKKAELCGLLHPSKRAKASNNSTATSYTPTPRKTKMTKRELRLEQHRSASPEEVVTSIDPSEGLGPYPEYQAHCATASRNADKRSTSESAHVIDGVSHEVSCIRTDVSRAYVPTQSCASNERIAEIKGDEDALTKVLNTLRSQRLSTPVIVQSNQRFIGEATPAKLGPEAEAVAYPDNDVRDPEESEDTIRLISPKKRVEPSHEASSRRILELAARLNA